MKILAIETATVAGSVAILDDSAGLIGEIRVDVKIAHAERLMPSIEWLMNSSMISIDAIDAYAISIGPGSFTGLRIGLSTVKGFAFATGKPVISVPTLDAFAASLPYCSFMICPILDARKSEVYTALYKWDSGILSKLMPETVISPSELLKVIDQKTLFTGEGVKIYKDLIGSTLQEKAVFAPSSRMSPSASSVADIALEKLKKGDIADPVKLTPLYIRKSEAEIKWKG